MSAQKHFFKFKKLFFSLNVHQIDFTSSNISFTVFLKYNKEELGSSL